MQEGSVPLWCGRFQWIDPDHHETMYSMVMSPVYIVVYF